MEKKLEKKIVKAPKPSSILPIDLATEIHIEIVGVIQKFKSSLIGMKVNDFIIVDMPSIIDTASQEKVSKNLSAKVIGRYVYRGVVFGFHSNLISMILAPTPMLFIRYPLNVEEHNIREHDRIACMLPGKIKLGADIFDGIVLDLCITGAQIAIVLNNANTGKLVAQLKKSPQFKFQVQLPGEPRPSIFTVYRKNTRSHNAKLCIGVEFPNLPAEDSYNIIKFIDYAKSLNLPGDET